MTDKHVGHLTYLRVYSGRARKSGEQVLNANRGRKERIGRLLQMHANKRQEVEEVFAGDIAAVVGLKSRSHRRDPLRSTQAPILLESLEFPEPVIVHRHRAEDGRRHGSLSASPSSAWPQEDPSFRVSVDEETGQTIISGMGELHLEIITDRLLREFNVGANVGKPQVAYKETITRPGRRSRAGTSSRPAAPASIRRREARGRAGQSPARASCSRAVKVKAAVPSPRSSFPAVRQGCEEAVESGPLAGYPVVDVHVRLVDGQTHDVDSSERSFKIAGSIAMRDALERGQAGPARADHADVEVVTPEEFVGAVQGDLNSRRGQHHWRRDPGQAPRRFQAAGARWPPCSDT